MATIKQRGDSYKITVSCGYDLNGKQIRRHLTWTPEPGMTKRQLQRNSTGRLCFSRKSAETVRFLTAISSLPSLRKSGSWTMPKSSCGREPSAAIVKCSPHQRGAGSYAHGQIAAASYHFVL